MERTRAFNKKRQRVSEAKEESKNSFDPLKNMCIYVWNVYTNFGIFLPRKK